MIKKIKTVFLVWLALGIQNCDRPDEHRHYQEITITKRAGRPTGGAFRQSPHGSGKSGMLQNAKGQQRLQWATPEGWQLQKSGSIRTATFRIRDSKYEAEGAIIQIPGDAGGLLMNVKMWMNQVQLMIPPDDQLEHWLKNQPRFQTASGLSTVLIDFTHLLSGNLVSETSMLAAVISAGPETVFVKLTGDKPLLIKNRKKFESLCRSIQTAVK